jgi:hypothetical protein
MALSLSLSPLSNHLVNPLGFIQISLAFKLGPLRQGMINKGNEQKRRRVPSFCLIDLPPYKKEIKMSCSTRAIGQSRES